jgi:hypothetical protein
MPAATTKIKTTTPRATPKTKATALLAAIDPFQDCGCGGKSWCHKYRVAKGKVA